MILSLPPLISPPTAYDFDQQNPGIPTPMFANNSLNDCVTAARAHHTIRLVYVSDRPPLPISETDVSTQYMIEAHNKKTAGLTLASSLNEWKIAGWTAASVSGRTIHDFVPQGVNGSDLLAPDPASRQRLMQCIIDNVGVQADMQLPKGISVDRPNTYGPVTHGQIRVWGASIATSWYLRATVPRAPSASPGAPSSPCPGISCASIASVFTRL